MKEIIDIFTDFLAIMRDDILEYYQKSHSYLKDLINYKKINLFQKTETESEKNLRSNLKKMLKAIKTGLNTIGVSMDTLNEAQNNFISTLNQNRSEIQDYNSYFEFYLMNYVNKILFNILIDYLLEKEVKKLENVNLFDLLPPYFVSKLDKFKKKYINPSIKELLIQQDIDNYVNFTDLSIKSKEVSELDILAQLREAKQDIIETLKTPKKDLIRPSIESIEAKSISKKSVSPVKLSAESDHDIHIELDSGTFLDHFGHFTPIHPDVRNRFRIEKVNLINSKVLNLDFFDLESLYLYISILKMLDLEVPFTDIEILEIVKNYINDKIFSSSKNEIPDSRNIFFGLALFSELNLYDKTDLIDLIKIKNFINSQIEKFIPEKLELNLHSLLCFKFIIKSQKININRNLIFDFLLKINLFTLDNFKPILDIYHHLALLKLLDKNVSLKQFETPYINEIKKFISPNGSINDLVTESARALLIFDLLNLKNKEPELSSLLLNYIPSFNFSEYF